MKTVESEKNLNKVIKIDEAKIHSHLDTMVRTTVEETLNRLLDEEADLLCNARRYEALFFIHSFHLSHCSINRQPYC